MNSTEAAILSGFEIWLLGFPVVKVSENHCDEICIVRIVLFGLLLFELFSILINYEYDKKFGNKDYDQNLCTILTILLINLLLIIGFWIYDSIDIFMNFRGTLKYDSLYYMLTEYQTLGFFIPIIAIIGCIIGGFIIYFVCLLICYFLLMFYLTFYMVICLIFNIGEIKKEISEKEVVEEISEKENVKEIPLAIEEEILSAEVV